MNLYSSQETKKITSSGEKLETETVKKGGGVEREEKKMVGRAFRGRRSVGDKTELLFFFPSKQLQAIITTRQIITPLSRIRHNNQSNQGHV